MTFAGSGEPTLNSQIGTVAGYLKSNHPNYKTCLLTNGTLFNLEQLRIAARDFDLIIPSLDAATEESFQKINRPHRDLRCERVIEGLVELRRDYQGEIRLEIFMVPGINDTAEELEVLKAAIKRIKPDRIQLGTLDRPGSEAWVTAAEKSRMKEAADYLGDVELIGDFQSRQKIASFNESHSRSILEILRRRPCTVKDLKNILNLHPAELQKYINYLLEKGKIEVEQNNRGVFLKIKKPAGKK